jgi:hypothetical protein
MMSNDEIINKLISDLEELIPMQTEHDGAIDGYGEYLMGVISRTQSVLSMMGVPQHQIPTDGSC